MSHLTFARVGLPLAGLLMLSGVFLPCMEIFGESSSAFHLATLGMGFPWLWILISSPLIVGFASFVRSRRWKASLAVAAGVGPLIALIIAYHRFGPVIWQILRSGGFLLLIGALMSVLSALIIIATSRRRPSEALPSAAARTGRPPKSRA